MTVSSKNGIDTMGQPTRSRHVAQKKMIKIIKTCIKDPQPFGRPLDKGATDGHAKSLSLDSPYGSSKSQWPKYLRRLSIGKIPRQSCDT